MKRDIPRKGVIYSEMTNKGRSSVRYVRGCKPVYCHRWVGEVTVNGKRKRFRSTSRSNVEAWVEDILAKYPTYQTGRPCRTQ